MPVAHSRARAVALQLDPKRRQSCAVSSTRTRDRAGVDSGGGLIESSAACFERRQAVGTLHEELEMMGGERLALPGALGGIAEPRPSRSPSGAPEARRHVFRTRQLDDAAEHARTFGVVVETGTGPLRFSEGAALAAAHPDPPADCARGKVVAVSRRGAWGEAACYQLPDCRTRARVVACGNAWAVAAAVHARATTKAAGWLRMALPRGYVLHVHTAVEPGAADDGHVVRQVWEPVPFGVRAAASVAGGRSLVFTSPLNDYLVLEARSGGRWRPATRSSPFTAADAIAAWHRARLGTDPLLARVVVVDPMPSRPRVRFFTCSREHPSAPLTGLAVLALTAREIGWLPLPADGCVETPAGPMRLPAIDVRGSGVARIEPAPTIVHLAPYPAAGPGCR